MKIKIYSRGDTPPSAEPNLIALRIDNWNDYSFVTMFQMEVFDNNSELRYIGNIKIGFKGQTVEVATHEKFDELPHLFDSDDFKGLNDEFFSLGQSVEFYRNIRNLPNNLGSNVLNHLKDIIKNENLIEKIKEEPVFNKALLRDISLSRVKGEYSRALFGQPDLTDFRFSFSSPETEKFGGIDLKFIVKKDSTPSTNIHAIIGRNGIGKTTILNNMITAITTRGSPDKFFDVSTSVKREISNYYFGTLVSVSFSAFDPFLPPPEQSNPALGTLYFYIGLKGKTNQQPLKTISELHSECAKDLINCFSNKEKEQRWETAIKKLGSDENFSSMKLERLQLVFQEAKEKLSDGEQTDSPAFEDKYFRLIEKILSGMSSGHAIVLLTITRLVATVEEKTLILMDEPESHLHPPLLSAFVRALGDLLYDQNGVAIIATHSPVVLQEIPRSCVKKIFRVGNAIETAPPNIETFGENVGLLTSEVFGLEVQNSGFHNLLSKNVASGETYEEIINLYDNKLGFEARAILRVLLTSRDRNK